MGVFLYSYFFFSSFFSFGFRLFQMFAHTHTHKHTFILREFDPISTVFMLFDGCWLIIIELVLVQSFSSATTTTTTAFVKKKKTIYNSKFQQFINQIELNMNNSLASDQSNDHHQSHFRMQVCVCVLYICLDF